MGGGSNSSNEESATLGGRQVKVDNWGTFFLLRLQALYHKNEHCDITLMFQDGGSIKAHKLVLLTCTDYFNTRLTDAHDTYCLPPALKHGAVLPIIQFMYTGRLDFKSENHNNIFIAAKLLNMTILMKLLNTQASKTDPKEMTQSTSIAMNNSSGRLNTPSKGLIKKIVNQTIGSPASLSPTTSQTLPGKKLPFWKKRTVPGYLPDEFYQSEATQARPMEPPRPTRFEWPEETDVKPPIMYSPTFDSISYDSELMVKPVELKRPHPASEDGGTAVSESTETAATGEDQTSTSSAAPDDNGPNENNKRLRMNDDVSNFTLDSEDEDDDDDDDDNGHFEMNHEPYDDDEDEDTDNLNTLSEAVNINSNRISDPLSSSRASSSDFLSLKSPSTPPSSALSVVKSAPKPILKPLLATSSPGTSKKVRFSLSSSEGKENSKVLVSGAKETALPNSLPAANQDNTAKLSIVSPGGKSAGNTANHAKIIVEVLKKYPELVKNNKNIRLKIMSPNNKVGSSVSIPGGIPKPSSLRTDNKEGKSNKSKVSYVVMKSDVPSSQTSATGGSNESKMVATPTSGAENMTGPWFCHSCGKNNQPLNFETYYLYRRHLQDVHMERIDARICEHCGHKSSKRNLHLYHLYTKHNVPPPRNISFPKCDQCDYIALSDSLLMKHRNNHTGTSKEYICKVCSAAFKSHGALQGHMQTSLHSENPNKEYQCEYCDKTFNRNINLKAHIRTAHKDESRKLYEEEDPMLQVQRQQQQQQNLLQVIQVPVIDALQGPNALKSQHTLLLPAGMTILAESPSVPLLPSSESEAMNNVASGIATSLNLAEANLMTDQTVIFLDGNSELLFEPGSSVVLSEDGGTCEVQEYIVPEIMGSEEMEQMYPVSERQGHSTVTVTTSAGVLSSTCTSTVVVASDGTIVNDDGQQQSSSDHTYAEEIAQAAKIDGQHESGVVDDEGMETTVTVIGQHQQPFQGVPAVTGSVATPVETIQFASPNSANAGSIQMMEVCERDSIIIQPGGSVIQQPSLHLAHQQVVVTPSSSGGLIAASPSVSSMVAMDTGSSTVIVSSEKVGAATAAVSAKVDLAQDWDDFDEDEPADGVTENGADQDEAGDDIRPSRPTIELDESILPDI